MRSLVEEGLYNKKKNRKYKSLSLLYLYKYWWIGYMLNEYLIKLPIWKPSDKPIEFFNIENISVGFVQRYYKNTFDKFFNSLPLPFVNIFETKNLKGIKNGKQLNIREQSLRSNLLKLKWDVYISSKNETSTYLLEDITKISINPLFIYHKNNNKILFKKDILNRRYEVSLDGGNKCAEIKIEKILPKTLRFILVTDELDILELIGIYYILSLTNN